MRLVEVSELLHGTGDAGFAVTSEGVVTCWNAAAEGLFGTSSRAATGRHCWDLVSGRTCECRLLCRPDCAVLDKAMQGQPISSFDMQVMRGREPHWVNVSVLVTAPRERYIIHLARDIDVKRKLEDVTRRFLMQVSALSGCKIDEMLSVGPTPHLELTAHERSILKLLAEGHSNSKIAHSLGIRPSTARNHVEHILQKLSVHSRMEAAVRAIRDKLV